MAKPHHKLNVWQRAMAFVKDIYQVTARFPEEEKFGLVSQMRRAAISIPSNIAEGAARNTHREFVHFLHIAQGSISELETQLIISKDLGLISEESCQKIIAELDEISKMVVGLQKSLTKH
ncbi:MAG: four helix bundle protein [Proteobacteria bacterium]|nr:four helix bundle protein [Pseudomonadota bacterium]MBU1714104.1 four helix bundle protein [Pseudomonadota bacterium]